MNMDHANRLPDTEFKKLVRLYSRHVAVPKEKPKKQFFVCPVGPVGAGKTTVMKPLSSRLSLARLSTDEIRKLLHDRGYRYDRAAEIAYAVAEKFVARGYSIGIDADCVDKDDRDRIEGFAKKVHARVFYLHIQPPEKFIIHKLMTHKHTWLFTDGKHAVHNYRRRKKLHKNLKIPFVYVFDTSKKNLKTQITTAVKDIRNIVTMS